NQFAQQGDTSCGRLLGAVVPKRIRLVLRFENEGSEPGRETVRQLSNRPRVAHNYFCRWLRVRASVSSVTRKHPSIANDTRSKYSSQRRSGSQSPRIFAR